MNVTNSSFDALENCDFTAFVVPNGASVIPSEEEQVYQPETKTGLFNDLLQLGIFTLQILCMLYLFCS